MKQSIRKAVFGLSILIWGTAISQNNINPAWVYFGDETNSDHVTDLWVTPTGESYIIGHMGPAGDNPDGIMLT